jgi:hypothetical protein
MKDLYYIFTGLVGLLLAILAIFTCFIWGPFLLLHLIGKYMYVLRNDKQTFPVGYQFLVPTVNGKDCVYTIVAKLDDGFYVVEWNRGRSAFWTELDIKGFKKA